MEKQDINSLINKAKASGSKKAIQKIVPVKNKAPETQFSFNIDSKLLKKIKMKAIENGCSYKQIIIDAFTLYLNQN